MNDIFSVPVGCGVDTETIIGSGSNIAGTPASLKIDLVNGAYSFQDTFEINAMDTPVTCPGGSPPPTSKTYLVGPNPGTFPSVLAPLPLNPGVLSGVTTFQANKSLYGPFTWTLTWTLRPQPVQKCKTSLTLPQTFGQKDNPWGAFPYDNEPGETIGSKGCALTSLTMALIYAGLTQIPNQVPFTTPLTVDNFMESHTVGGKPSDDFTSEHGVEWSNTVNDLSIATFGLGKHLVFDDLGGARNSAVDAVGTTQQLDNALCSQTPHPVIVGVKLGSTDASGSPGHFVLVTGADGNGDYTILDPATGTGGSLNNDYLGEFSTRGIVRDPSADVSGLNIDAGANVSLLVTDTTGNRTGADPSTGNPLQEIPGSAYFVDRLNDDITGAIDNNPSHMVVIPTPKQGTFRIVAQGLNTGPYSVVVRGFAQDGSPQPPIVFNGNATLGSITTYTINYVSTPGATSAVTFSAFAAKVEISTGSHPGFEVRGSFTLGAGSSGITPDTQPVTLTLGSFTTTIPAGSFKRHASGSYAFEGTINGVRLEFRITPVDGNSFEFNVEAHDVSLAATTNPIPLALLIGSDGGTAQSTLDD